MARCDESGDRAEWRRRLAGNHRIGITRATAGVIDRKPIYDEIDKITAPTLVIVGEEDVATVPAKARRIHERIAGSKLVVLPRGGHTSTVEEPAAVNAAMREFLGGL